MRGGPEAVSAENRLTAEQVAALSPGDNVTIESGSEFGRRRYATATVVRLLGSRIVVKCEGPRGGTFVGRYGRRDGVGDSGGRAELIDPGIGDPPLRTWRDVARSGSTRCTGSGVVAALTMRRCASFTRPSGTTSAEPARAIGAC
jgi:hypothetical protein